MGERLLRLHFPPSIIRQLQPELPHGGRPHTYPKLTSCVLTPSGLNVTLMLPYAVCEQLRRLDAGLPLQDPRQVNASADDDVLLVTEGPQGPRLLRCTGDGSAFKPYVPDEPEFSQQQHQTLEAASAPPVAPDSTTPNDCFGSGLCLEDYASFTEDDLEVTEALLSMASDGASNPHFSPDLRCYESMSSMDVEGAPASQIICDRCGHLSSSPSFCSRCTLEHLCDQMGESVCTCLS